MLHPAKAGLTAAVVLTGAVLSRAETARDTAFSGWIEPRFGIEMIALPPGEFDMGSPPDEPGRETQERLHRVRLTRGFSLARYEVTQVLWTSIMKTNPSHFLGCGPRCPVERVSFRDVTIFLEQLNQQVATPGFRLPSEAEWEYACRAGGGAAFGTSGTLTTDAANYNGEYPLPGGRKGVVRKTPVPVGSFRANAWGFSDMHGNVWEWTADWYCDYPSRTVTDPLGRCESGVRVIRGGSWHFDAASARCALRYTHRPQDSGFSLGFRLAHTRAPDGPEGARR